MAANTAGWSELDQLNAIDDAAYEAEYDRIEEAHYAEILEARKAEEIFIELNEGTPMNWKDLNPRTATKDQIRQAITSDTCKAGMNPDLVDFWIRRQESDRESGSNHFRRLINTDTDEVIAEI